MDKRKVWDPNKMESAVRAVIDGEMGYLKAAKTHEVPLTSVKRFVKRVREEKIPANKIGEMIRVPLGRKPVLNALNLEDELVKYCIQMDETYYGLRRRDICKMAYYLATFNKLKHPFSLNSSKAGKKWLRKFLRRHPELSFRKPQPISANRVKSFTRENVARFFEILKPKLELVNFQPHRVFNCDETGITIVQHNPEKVLTVRGKREVHKLSSAERGALITVVTCMSAAGQYIPPMIIFPKSNKKHEYGDGAPAGSLIEYNPSGWISTTLFTKWFRHFIKCVHATKEDPVLLVFDGHFSHTRNLELVNLARDNHIILICLPPHTSAKMQPLDVAFMKPLKTFYSAAIENWMDNHKGRVVTHLQVASLFKIAYVQAATMETAENGFRKTGIIPFNPNVFTDVDFLTAKDRKSSVDRNRTNTTAAATTSTPTPSISTPLTPASTTSASSVTSAFAATPAIAAAPAIAATPVTAAAPAIAATPGSLVIPALVVTPAATGGDQNTPITPRVSPSDITPIPVIPDAPPSNRRGCAKVISDSPHKNQLIEAEKKKAAAEQKKKKNAASKKKNAPSTSAGTSKSKDKKPTKTVKSTKKESKKPVKKRGRPPKKSKLEESYSSSDESEDEITYASSTDSDEDDDAACQFCSVRFTENHQGEDWIRCSKCWAWSHETCDAAVEDTDKSTGYICSVCLST